MSSNDANRKSPAVRLSMEPDHLAVAYEHAESSLGVSLAKYVSDLVLTDLRAEGLIPDGAGATPAEALDLCLWLKGLGGAPVFPIIYQNAETTKSVALDAYIEYLRGKKYFQRTKRSTNEKVCLRLRWMRGQYESRKGPKKGAAVAVLAQLAVEAAHATP